MGFKLTKENSHLTARYGFAFFIALAGLFISLITWNFINTTPFIFFFATVSLSAWFGGLGPGVFCAALSVMLADYYLIEPRYAFLTNSSDVIHFITFSLVAFLISWTENHRLESEQLLHQAHDQLHIILNGINEGVTAQDQHGKPVFANKAAALLTGYASAEAMMNTTMTQLYSNLELLDSNGKPLSPHELPRHSVFRTGQPGTLTFQMRQADSDTTRWIELNSAPVFDEKQNVILAVNIFRDVTEMMELELERTQYHAIVHHSDDAIISKTLDGMITSWNAGAKHIYGYSADEVIGQHISIIFPPEIKTRELQLTERIRQGEKIEHYDTIRVHKDGRRIHISLTINPIHNYLGEAVGYATIERDITQRVMLAKQQKENERHLRKILDTLPILVGVMKPDGTLIEANHAALSAAKLTENDVLNKPFPETYWWSYSSEIQQQLWNAIEQAKQGEPVRYDVPIRIENDQYMTIDFMISPMFDADGTLTHLVPSALDITDRIQREGEIFRLTLQAETQRRRLKNIIANVPGIVYEGSGDFDAGKQQMDFISEYAQKLLGYQLEEWKSEPNFWEKVVHPEDWERAVTQANQVYESGEPGSVQFRCITKDGQVIHTEAHSAVIVDADGARYGTCGVVMDITERKLMENTLVQYMDDLKRSNEELEQFAYVASHDLQEPLRMVTSYLQLIEKRYSDKLDESAHEFIEFAVDGASRMKILINDLLTYSRIQRSTIKYERVNMAKVFDQVIQNLQLTIQDTGAQIEVGNLPEITANEAQMLQLMQNLIGNGIKFHHPDTKPIIQVGCERQNHHWVFSIADNGIGIDPQYMDRIFIIFQRLHTRDEYSGTGIGLAVSKKIVEKHGGKIWLESEPGKGTTFYFSIPVKQPIRMVFNGSN